MWSRTCCRPSTVHAKRVRARSAALATPLGLSAVEALYVRLYAVAGDWPVALVVLRLTLSFAVLVVPTTLMGATLPLVVKSAIAHGAILGHHEDGAAVDLEGEEHRVSPSAGRRGGARR